MSAVADVLDDPISQQLMSSPVLARLAQAVAHLVDKD